MLKILGIDDSVNTCECCGKSNLKSTVVVEINGQLFHYGSVCATKHTSLTKKQIKETIKDELDARKLLASTEYKESREYLAEAVKMSQAHEQKLIGIAFRNYCSFESNAAKVKYNEIKQKYNLEYFSY